MVGGSKVKEWMDKRAQVDIDKAESSFGRLNL
jgi:hypothetical protein